MSREPLRKPYYSRDPRNRDRDWDRPDYRSHHSGSHIRKGGSSPRDLDKHRSRSPRKSDKDSLDENILSEISKLPEPSELWDNQFQESGFPPNQAPPPPTFSSEGVTNTSYGSSYQPSYSGIYDDFPPVAQVPATPHPPDIASWNQMSLPPPPTPAPMQFMTSSEDQLKKEAAIESEMRHQKAALSKQREDYMKKASILKKELDTLKDQRNELRGDAKRSPSPDTKRFLKENTKLQLEIQNKLKTINNVVDMLNGIIGEEAQELPHDSDDSERASKRKSRHQRQKKHSMHAGRDGRSPSAGRKFNYVYYDPEMHWCRVCNEFPPTAKDYLNHLHSPAHHKMAAAHMEAPWHEVPGVNEGFPSFPSAPTKRTPIRGLQFFVPSTAWYCKLCDQFIGDLHCASGHLKSTVHSKNYTNFVEQNPHWETDWMSDRQKAFEKARASGKTKPKAEEQPQYAAHTITFSKDGFHTKRKDSSPLPTADEKKKNKKDKKKRKKSKRSSSSSSSSSDSSDSDTPKKKKKKKEKRPDVDDKTLTEWMSAIQSDRLNDSDRKLLDSLKSRIKQEKRDDDKRRSTSRSRDRSPDQRKNRESERDSRPREARTREPRNRESRTRESRARDNRDTRWQDRHRDSPAHAEAKKPEIRKMPFIGKMPVYKSLGKTKTEEQKKEEQKKKEEDEATKKKREEMDAEIQKKVAEFKEKIARAQLERAPAGELPPLALPLPLPAALGSAPAHASAPAPAPPMPPITTAQPMPAVPALPKDFQEALDIIFPSEVKPQTDIFNSMASIPPGFPMTLGSVMPTFPQFMQPQVPQVPQMMVDFSGLNTSLFPRPQLYDRHVPLVPSPKPRPNNKGRPNNNNNKNKNQNNAQKNQNYQKKPNNASSSGPKGQAKENGNAEAKMKEELADLAMLGIDASDVGSGM